MKCAKTKMQIPDIGQDKEPRMNTESGLRAARQRLTHLVGRDTTAPSERELARAVVESVAENTSDAVVAPPVRVARLAWLLTAACAPAAWWRPRSRARPASGSAAPTPTAAGSSTALVTTVVAAARHVA